MASSQSVGPIGNVSLGWVYTICCGAAAMAGLDLFGA